MQITVYIFYLIHIHFVNWKKEQGEKERGRESEKSSDNNYLIYFKSN